MKHWLSLVNVPEVDQYLEIAKFAETAGFDGISLADHLIIPTKVESKYPYTPDGKTWWPDDTPWPDPWVTLSSMAAVTEKLQFATNIYLAALRDPFTAAKAISTAAVLSGNRMVCGVSAGWIKEEYDLLGLDFKARGRRLDEMLLLMKQLWSGSVVSHHGEFFDVENAIMSPAPTANIKIWSGGASKPAFRRAAENDGWLGVPMMTQQVLDTQAMFQQMRSEMGKQNEPFDFCVSLIEPLKADTEKELEDHGIHHNMVLPWLVTPWGRTPWLKDDEDPANLDVKKRVLERFSESVIQR